MCKLCDNYDFSRIGYDFDDGPTRPTVYFPGGAGVPDENERFRFCPVCGKELTEENFKWVNERKKLGMQ